MPNCSIFYPLISGIICREQPTRGRSELSVVIHTEGERRKHSVFTLEESRLIPVTAISLFSLLWIRQNQQKEVRIEQEHSKLHYYRSQMRPLQNEFLVSHKLKFNPSCPNSLLAFTLQHYVILHLNYLAFFSFTLFSLGLKQYLSQKLSWK